MKEGWEYKKLNELCEVITKGTTPTTLGYTFSDVGINFIKIESISTNRKLLKDKLNYISEECNKFMSRSQLQENDLLFSIAGALGRIYIVEKSVLPANTNQALAIIRLKTKQDLFLQYLSYYLSSNTLKKQIDKDKVGVAQLNLSLSQIKNFIIPIPSITVQQHIVEELDLLSSIIEKKKAQLNELDNLAQSLFYEMFGDPITNENGWEVKKMGEVCNVTSSKRIFASEYCCNGVPFYRGKEITEKSKGQEISVELYISTERYEEIKKEFGIPTKGDVLITAVGTIGNIWVVNDEEPFYFKDGNIIWLKDIKGINSVYFKTILSILIAAYKQQMAQGCAYNALTIVNLKKMFFALPPIDLQNLFASKIEAIEHQKELIKQSIKEVETLLNSRMDYYFN